MNVKKKDLKMKEKCESRKTFKKLWKTIERGSIYDWKNYFNFRVKC